MATNDFEKRVQQQMGDFKLRPSKEVWLIVEEKIRERRRRRLLFWLLPFVVGGGYLIYSQWPVPSTPMAAQETKASPGTETKINSAPVTTPESPVSSSTPTFKGQQTGDPSTSTAKGTDKSNILPGEKQVPANPVSKAPSLTKNSHSVNHKPSTIYTKTEPKSTPASKRSVIRPRSETDPVYLPAAVPATVPNSVPSTIAISVMDAKPMTLPVSRFVADRDDLRLSIKGNGGISLNNPIHALQGALRDPIAFRPAKWLVSVKLGLFNQAEPLLSGMGQKSVADQQSSVGNGNGSSAVSNIVESEPTASLGFGFQINRQFRLNERHQIRVGLGYAHYRTNRTVGEFRDSSAFPNFSLTDQSGGFYRGGTTTRFRSNYGWLEIPVSMVWDLNKRTGGLRLETGLQYSRLLHGRGLIYGGYGYFDDQDQIRKNQWSLLTGLHWDFRYRGRFRSVGIVYQGGLSSFYKPEVGSQKIGRMIGLKLSIPFGH